MITKIDILNGFASKVISDCIDITIDALNEFPYNKYKKDKKVYDAAESMRFLKKFSLIVPSR